MTGQGDTRSPFSVLQATPCFIPACFLRIYKIKRNNRSRNRNNYPQKQAYREFLKKSGDRTLGGFFDNNLDTDTKFERTGNVTEAPYVDFSTLE